MDRARKHERAATRRGWLLYLDVGAVPALVLALVSAMGCRAAVRDAGGPAAAARPGPSTAQAAASGPLPRIVSYLQDDFDRIFPERVRLSHYGSVRYAALDVGDAGGDGERSDAIDMGDAMTMVVVDKVRDRVRVIAPQDHYRLLLWVEERDLYTVVTEVAPLSPGIQGAPGRPAASGAGIRLHPGLAVQVDGESRGMAHIRHRDACVSFSGLVPRTALGSQFVPIQTGERSVDSVVAAGTAVFDRPGGRQVARFVSECDVAATGPERDGFRPVLYASEWFELRGWIATGSGKAGSASGGGSSWGYGYGQMGLWGSRSRFHLPEGTCLFARRGGPAIGLVVDEAEAPLSPPVNGWWQLPLETVWGDLNVWVAQDRSRPPEEKRAEVRPTASLRAYDADPKSAEGAGDAERSDDDETRLPALRRCR
jgi:hypothetical protein